MLKEKFLQHIQQIKKFWNSFDREKFKLSPKRFTFLFFLLLSTILWFLNALSREYADRVDYPIRYINYPKDFVLLNQPPEELQLDVKAFGYSLFYHKITPDLMPLRVDFGKTPLRLLRGGDTLSYFIESNYLQSEISNQISSEIKLNGIKPDSIIFTFTKTISKKVPVIFNGNLSFRKPFQQKGTTRLVPDSVVVQGPQAIINNLDSVQTEAYESDLLGENKKIELKLEQSKYINTSVSSIIVEIEVEKYTEREIILPLSINHLPDSLVLLPFPNQIHVSFTTSLENFNKISKYDFKAELDYKDVKHSISNRIPVILRHYPNGIRNLAISPRRVEFIVEKK